MNRIVVPFLPPPGARVTVDEAGSHHLLRVQRVARGAPVVATDAGGARAQCSLVDAVDGRAVLEVVAVLPAPRFPERVVVLGVPRGPALEEALTVGTEAGAHTFRLVRAERSPPGQARPDRLERVLRAALTQCGRADLPAVIPCSSLAEAFTDLPARRWLGSAGGRLDVGPTSEAAAVAIGPEGGWSPNEERALVEAGFTPFDLGPYILRTPTAVTAALARLWTGPSP